MKKFHISFIAASIATLIFSANAFAATIITAASGNWSATTTWVGGVVPTAADEARIDGNRTVTITGPGAVCTNLVLGVLNAAGCASCGTLVFGNAGSTLTSTGLTTFGWPGPGGTTGIVDMTLGGTFTSGIWSDLKPGLSRFIPGIGTNAKVIFTGNFTLPANANFGDFNDIEIAAGANTVTLGRDITVALDLTLTNGTLSAGTFGIMVKGNWTNAGGAFTEGTGTVTFNGTGTQTITYAAATETFYNLTTNTTGPLTLASTTSVTVTNALTMTSGLYNLNTRTLTLGTAAATPGTLSYTAGFMYGGTFKRWFNTTSFAITNAAGHFPMGTSVGDYRPLWVAYSANLTTGGTISVRHNPTYPSGTVAASHVDGSWAGGTTLQGVSNSTWSVSTGDGFTFSASNGIMRFGGQGFQTFTLTDLNASLLSSVVGTYGASTNVNTPLEVNRTALSTANFTNTWRIGTKNIGQSPLPVEWLYFNAIPENNSLVRCEWATGSELNNDYFAVQRSKDGNIFSQIGTVQGSGNSSIMQYYTFYDHEPFTGISYYRLKQVDYNGQYEYSHIRQVYIGTFNIITIYPNPSSEYIQYTIASENGGTVTVKVMDVLGREVISTEEVIEGGVTTKKLSTANLSSGNYLLRITTGEQFATANPSSGGEKTQKQFMVK